MNERVKSQSILEYTLLLGVVIAAMVAVLIGPGGISTSITNAYETAGDVIEDATESMTDGLFE